MATSSVSEHVRQSPAADLGSDLAALSCKSLLKSDSLPLWSASSTPTSTAVSSQSLVLPRASAVCHWGQLQPWLDWRGDWWVQAPVVQGCGWLLAGWAEYCTHCWCYPPQCQQGPLAAFTLRCVDGAAVPFLVLETKGKCEEQLPNWSASGWHIQCGGNWMQSAGSACRAAHRCWGSGALKFWGGDRSEYFTHWACVASTRLSSGGEKPWKKPHQISPTDLREDHPEGGVHLLIHPSPLVLLFLNHPESLVLIILGQHFHFKDHPLFKLSLGLGGLL